MLKSLDVLIGLALVMVLLSPLVTAVTQIWMWIWNRRTFFLQEMLQRLLVQLGSLEANHTGAGADAVVVDEGFAKAVARAVASHPVVARGSDAVPWLLRRVPPFKNRTAEVIEREELIRVLIELAAGEGSADCGLSAKDRQQLQRLLKQNGIPHPAATLAKVRNEAQDLEDEKPETPVHVRHAQAIVRAAHCDLVGKINHWFDAASTRATQQYAAEARVVTIVAAMIVAFAIQFDTVTLLGRLSTDTKMREDLLAQARATPDEIDKQEILKHLANLSGPSLSVLPDHFIWQSVPRRRLERNPLWTTPYPASLTLVTGGSSYTIPVRWRRDPLVDIKAAIDASTAPVTTNIVSGGTDVIVRSRQPLEFHVLTAADVPASPPASALTDLSSAFPGSRSRDLAVPLHALATATLDTTSRPWTDARLMPSATAQLVVDDRAYPLTDLQPTAAAVVRAISTAKAPVTLMCLAGADLTACPDTATTSVTGTGSGTGTVTFVQLVATNPQVRELRLLWQAADPFSNVLSDTSQVGRAWRLRQEWLDKAAGSETTVVAGTPGRALSRATIPPVPAKSGTEYANQLNTAFGASLKSSGLSAAAYPADDLVITARRLGPLELRYAATQADSNILDTRDERRASFAGLFSRAGLPGGFDPAKPTAPNEPTLFGVLLSWVLLSLGAPFWYDALKNLLKLRPSAAVVEERNRADRNTEGPSKNRNTEGPPKNRNTEGPTKK